MPIKVTVELTKHFEGLHIYDHIGGNRELFPKDDGTLGPWWVETDNPPREVGRLLFRYGEPDRPTERFFDVEDGGNELPAHKSFTGFRPVRRDARSGGRGEARRSVTDESRRRLTSGACDSAGGHFESASALSP